MKIAAKIMVTALVLVFVLMSPIRVFSALPAETRWADPSHVQLNVEFPGNGYHASWKLFRCACGDLLVYAELATPDDVETGELLLVGGKAVLIKGFGDYKQEAAASLDAAALMMQLALRLLERSEPDGPAKVSSSVEVDVLDEINHIFLDTGYAEGGFQAPWSIKGRISAPADSVRKFDLNFSFTIPAADGAQEASMRLYGDAEYAKIEFPVPGSSPIGDWDLGWRDESRARPISATTLEELRAELATDQIR